MKLSSEGRPEVGKVYSIIVLDERASACAFFESRLLEEVPFVCQMTYCFENGVNLVGEKMGYPAKFSFEEK